MKVLSPTILLDEKTFCSVNFPSESKKSIARFFFYPWDSLICLNSAPPPTCSKSRRQASCFRLNVCGAERVGAEFNSLSSNISRWVLIASDPVCLRGWTAAGGEAEWVDRPWTLCVIGSVWFNWISVQTKSEAGQIGSWCVCSFVCLLVVVFFLAA